MKNFREEPIVRQILDHTGKLNGDDSGYRDVRVIQSDLENPDPLVILNAQDYVKSHSVYAHGKMPGVCPFYPYGLGANRNMLIRKPAAEALKDADKILSSYGRTILVLDAWRDAHVQASLWADIRKRLLEENGNYSGSLSILEEIRYGRKADDTGSFAGILFGSDYEEEMKSLRSGSRWNEVEVAATELDESVDDVAKQFLTFQANLGLAYIPLNTNATTAHGGGGAADIWLLDSAGKPCNLGVPFDSTSPWAVMDAFERRTCEQYREAVAQSQELRNYLAELGVRDVTPDVFANIREERRLLFNAMMSVGATFFSLGAECGEPWHFNFPCELGGNMAKDYPMAGSGCQSILKNVRDKEKGDYLAVWGNESAHKMAAKILGL